MMQGRFSNERRAAWAAESAMRATRCAEVAEELGFRAIAADYRARAQVHADEGLAAARQAWADRCTPVRGAR